jgi:hypothetical protein
MALQVYQPEEMRRIGGGRSEGDDFAGLGGSFAASGGSGEFLASYLQNRISGLNRSTVSPRVNQMRVMKSPEFALAKTLGVSTAYNSGGSQVDVGGAKRDLGSMSPSAREDAQKRLDSFRQKNANVPMNPALDAAGFNPVREQDYSGPDVTTQNAFDEIQRRFGRGSERKAEIPQTRGSAQGGQSIPTIPASDDQAATPPSVRDAQNATRAPIGAPAVGAGGSQTLDSLPATTPSRETTKGTRLDTARIGDTVDAQENATRSLDSAGSAEEKMAIAERRNAAQDEREKIKMGYDREVQTQANIADRNKRFFGNPAGPDGGRSFANREKPSALSPVGGYEERYVVGQRGGNQEAPRGTPGYMEKENVPVGPMTNRPAATQQEANQRIAKFNAEGDAQKQRNKDAADKGAQDARRRNVEQLNKKYAGPIGRRVA